MVMLPKLLVMVRKALFTPTVVGLKTMLIWQLWPAGNVVGQLLVCAKATGVFGWIDEITMLLIVASTVLTIALIQGIATAQKTGPAQRSATSSGKDPAGLSAICIVQKPNNR